MEYTKTNWVNGETALNADNMNNIEDGIERAKNSINSLGAGKENVGIAEQKVNQHNNDINSHQDIRDSVSSLQKDVDTLEANVNTLGINVENKFDKANVVEEFGDDSTKVISQKFFSDNVRWRKLKEITCDGTEKAITLKFNSNGVDNTIVTSSGVDYNTYYTEHNAYNNISVEVHMPAEAETSVDKFRVEIFNGSKINYCDLESAFTTTEYVSHYVFERCGGIFTVKELKVLSNGGIGGSNISYKGLRAASTYLDKVTDVKIMRNLGKSNFSEGTKFVIYAN